MEFISKKLGNPCEVIWSLPMCKYYEHAIPGMGGALFFSCLSSPGQGDPDNDNEHR